MVINENKVKTISDFTISLREALDMVKAPYSPWEAIQKLGGKSDADIEDESIDAFIAKDGDNSFYIHINSNKPQRRTNFTLAHELGHLFLHMGFIINPEKWKNLEKYDDSVFFRSSRYSLEEFEANEFAGSFLMPEKEFIDCANLHLDTERNSYNLEPISDCFEVSQDSVILRGKRLGIFV
jgi:Zn-dependent peptidase ImmA (M78 family)